MLRSVDDRYPSDIAETVKKLWIRCIEKAHIGQGYDIYWAKIRYIPTLSEYLFMIDHKTGIAFDEGFNLCIESIRLTDIQVPKERKELVMRLLSLLGRFFQIRDDYINLTCPKYWQLKGFCEDLDERKASYVFTILRKQDETDTLYQQLCSKDILTNDDKIDFYTHFYNKQIFYQIYFDLDTYTSEIIKTEQQITQNDVQSEFLQHFFSKLEYNLPLEPDKLIPLLALNMGC
jgi:geranylgeranyl pyrophosphate synthase